MKRQATEWERMFTNHISYKELKIYKELMQLNSKNKNKQKANPIKNGQRL